MRLTRNILSMFMKSLPILHRPSVDSSGIIPCGTLVSNCKVNVGGRRTYGHTVEVTSEFPGNLIGEFATCYR